MPIRAVYISILFAVLCSTASASVSYAQESTRVRTTSGTQDLIATEGFEVSIFARRLGEISDMTRHPDGTLYVADRGAGRIFRIQDRAQDGSADLTQPLPQRFDTPTGLTFVHDQLFVADRGGLWRVDPGGSTPDLIAPFARSGSTGDPHPITTNPDGTIRLGQTLPDGTARLLDVNIHTGVAKLVETGRGVVRAFSRSDPKSEPTAPVWPIIERDSGIWFGSSLSNARKMNEPADHIWIDMSSSALLLASPKSVSRAPAMLGGIGTIDRIMLDGFTSGQSVRGRPGPMVVDARGLFVADIQNGLVLRVSAISDPEPPPVIEDPPEAAAMPDADPPAISSKPELLRGSGISQASTMGPASRMGQASTLPPPDEQSQAEDPNE